MADFQAGDAWVELKPSARGFSKEAKKALAAIDLDKTVELDAEKSQLEAAVKEVRQQLKALDREKASPSIEFESAVAEAKIREVQAKLDELGKKDPSPKVDVDTAKARQELDLLERQLIQIDNRRANATVDADISQAQATLQQLDAKLDEVNRRRAAPKVDADTTVARQRLEELDRRLTDLSRKKASPEVELKVAQAQQEALRIRAELDRLSMLRASPQVDADIASASAKLAMVNQQLSQLDGRTARVNVNADSGGRASLILMGVVAALGAIGAAAPAAAAALLAVGGAVGGLGQGIAGAMAGFSGVGDALKALEQDEKSAASSSAASSNKRAQAAKQVESAQRSLQQAQTQAARTAITSGQQVSDAERSVGQAVQAVGRARVQADQQVAAARRAVSDAVASANQRVVSAERSLENAQRSRQWAQESLTEAVKDATRANRDLNMSVAGAALSEERAALSLAQARERLAKSTSSDPLERADLALSVREAEQNLREVQTRYGDLRQDQAEWARSGVMGSKQVRSAVRGVEDAQRGVQDAQRALTEAQVSGARQVQDAQENLARTQQQAAQSVADAQAQVADAQRNVGRAAQQAGWAQEDAARQVADAQRALAEAYEQSGDSASASSSKAADALAKLTPAGRSLVGFLRDEWQPAWKRVTDSVAEEMLPKVEDSLRNLLALEPVVKAGLTETGSVIGDLAVKGSLLASSPPFQQNFASIMATNNRQLRDYGDAGISLFGALTDLYTVGGPVAERFSRLAANSMQSFESFIIGKRASGELEEYLQRAGDALMYVGEWIVDVATDVYQFAEALAPLGVALLEVTRFLTDWIAYLAQLSPGLSSFLAGVTLAAVGASKLGTAMKGLAIANAAGGLKSFGSILATVFNPAAAAAAMQSSTLSQRLTGTSSGADAASKASKGFAGAATRVAGSLPLLGAAITGVAIAHDAMNTSFDEGVEKLGKGGKAARDLQAELEANDRSLNEMNGFDRWANETLGVVETTESFNRKLADLRATWTDLENAQYDAGIAQGNYEDAVRQFGENSPQAVQAQQALADASGRVAQEQNDARLATMNATQAMEDQKNKVLGSINARLGYEQSVRSTKDAQKALNDAIAESGPNSDAAADAAGRLQSQQVAQAEAAAQVAAEEATKRGETDTSAASTKAYAEEVGKLVDQSKGQLTPALLEMVQGLDGAGLAAAGAKVHINDAGTAVATFPNGKTVELNAQTSPDFFANLQAAKAAVDSTKGTIGVDADPGVGVQKVGAFKLQVDQTTGVIGIDGNITPADQDRLGIKAKTDGTTGTMWINGNPVPCNGELNGMRVRVDETTGVMTIDGDPAPANQDSADAHRNASTPQSFPLDTDTNPADQSAKSWWQGLKDWFVNNGLTWQSLFGAAGGGPVPPIGAAQGGYIGEYAAGGAISHKQVIGFPTGGRVRGPGTATSDSIPAMLSNGEYVIRASAVQALGIPLLNQLNGFAQGGPVGLAAGGQAKPSKTAESSVPVPAGDPSTAAAAAAATGLLAGAMDSAAVAAGVLRPELAGVQAGQQALVAAGVNPLASSITGSLLPAFGAYGTTLGVTAPAANTALQSSQLATRTSTALTAANTSANSANMASAVTGMSQQAQAQHAGLRAGQAATQASTNVTAQNTAANSSSMSSSVTGMSSTSQQQHSFLRQSQGQTVQANNALATNTQMNTNRMSGDTSVMSGTVQNHLGQVRGSQGVTASSTTAFADAWRAQLGRTMPDSANPLRWVINFPIRSITDAWNHLDAQFALGKRVNPFIPNFATGGKVSGPGGGTDDRVPAMLSNGEFVVREAVTSRVMPFLKALNSGQPEALQAASAGRRPDPMVRLATGGSVAGAVARATQVARSMSGKPYIWGGASPAGADCSGYQSIITNALRGEGSIYRRIGTTGTFPWAGFTPGLTSMYAVGAFKGNPGHMAGTLAGANVESGGSPSRVKYGAGAVGADNGQFNIKASLPVVGGKFVSGGAGGGGFDIGPVVDEAFAKTYREVDDVTKFFGSSPQVVRGQGVARTSADRVKAHASAKLSEMFASMGGGGNVEQWRGVVMQALGMVGQAPSLADTTLRRMQQESGGNPSIVNNWDSNARRGTPSVGLMQVIGPTYRANADPRRDVGPYVHGTSIDPLSNVLASMHYTLRRYGSLPAGYNRPGGYDHGGLLMPGRTLVENNTGMPERVLDNVETKSYDTLTRLVGKNGVNLTLADRSSSAPTIGTLNAVVPQGATVNDMARAVTFEVRRTKRGGVYSRG